MCMCGGECVCVCVCVCVCRGVCVCVEGSVWVGVYCTAKNVHKLSDYN